jgi:predicted metal-dependent peptidase
MSKKQTPLCGVDPQDEVIFRAWRVTSAPATDGDAGDGDGQGASVDSHEQMHNGEPLTAEEKAAVEETIERAREEAAKTKERLKGEGSLGAELDIEIETPIIPWLEVLRTALTSIPAKTSKTWRTVSRRTFGAFSSYQQGRAGTTKALDTLTVMVDTSGSMGTFLGTAGADIMELIATLSPRILEIIYYDDGICGRRMVTRRHLRSFELTSMVGGGGTSVIRALQQLTQPRAISTPVVVLTDGMDSFNLPSALMARLGEVIWCAYDADIVPNYGRAIRIDKE